MKPTPENTRGVKLIYKPIKRNGGQQSGRRRLRVTGMHGRADKRTSGGAREEMRGEARRRKAMAYM